MNTATIERRTAWRSLSKQDKQQRLEELRRHHQVQVELEIRRLQSR